jgi:molybdopterin-synthase adenylyltransferase
VIPKLKNAVWDRVGEDLYVVSEPETQIVLSDPTGQVEQLLGLLREGTRDVAQLNAALAGPRLAATSSEISDAIAALDDLRLLVDATAPMELTEGQAERSFSNLAFFTTFASLNRSPASFQGALLDAHVVFLGTGGLGSTAIQAMTGAGVGQMTLLDNDVVSPRNFARQYLYRAQDIGMPKVELAAAWVRGFSPGTDVRAVSRWIGGPDDVTDLLTEADLVVSGVDQPAGIDLWVNEACVGAGVPYVRGGMIARRLAYWSVDPGRSPCMACHQHELTVTAQGHQVAAELRRAELERVNRGIGPVASMVGALVAMEALRYLTGFAPPIAAGCERFVDFASGDQDVQHWARWPECPVCQTAPRPPAAAVPATGVPDATAASHG